MLSYLWEIIRDALKSRLVMLSAIFIAMFGLLIYRVFDLQILNEDYYMDTYVQKAVKERTTKATRGNIYDCNGNVLASNELAYSVTLEDVLESSTTKAQQLNEIIAKTIEIIESNGDEVSYSFKLSVNEDDQLYLTTTSDTAKTRFLKDIYGDDEYEERGEELENAGLGEIYDYLVERYGLEEFDLTQWQKLQIINVRYNLSQNMYQKYISTEIASNVSEETVAAISENEAVLSGVSISKETTRVYTDGIYFAHIIGYTGTISETQLAEYTQEGYDYDATDVVGKAGLEQSMETYLQGTKGYQQFFADSTGSILQIIEEKEAEAGNDLYLTIDKKTQIATYHLLEQKIAGILVSKISKSDPLTDADFADTENLPDIYVSIKDVYFQLINNNILDMSHFSKKTASTAEQAVYAKFKARKKDVIASIKADLNDESGTKISSLSSEYIAYSDYIYEMLKDDGYLLTSKIDTSDETYQKYLDEEISMKEFLTYAISNNWIEVSKLELDDKYATTEDIYAKLVKEIVTLFKTDKGFHKLIYKYLIYNGTVSGNELCMILYDQNVLSMDQSQYNKLSAGSSDTAYKFMIKQLENLTITPAQIALDPCSGSVVLTDPNTGAVKALVTYPSYDNNYLSGTVDSDYWAKLLDDSSQPLYNRATQTTLAPGSTFKIVSAIAGLEEGVITTGETISATGIFTKISPSAKCWIYPSAHGATDVVKAIGVSCNYYFYEVGYRLGTVNSTTFSNELGLSKLKKYADMLGLTSTSGVEIQESEPIFSTESAVRSAIGQGKHGYTATQLARYISTVANHGSNYALTLIDRVEAKSGEVVMKQKSKLEGTVDISESTWNAVYSGLERVTSTNGGTVGSVFKDFDVKVAGKTGTAQESIKRFTHAVFVGYAPASDPKYAISVFIPYGDESAYASEVARDVLRYCYGELSLKTILKGTADETESGLSND